MSDLPDLLKGVTYNWAVHDELVSIQKQLQKTITALPEGQLKKLLSEAYCKLVKADSISYLLSKPQ